MSTLNTNTKHTKLRVLDLFAGVGGMSEGFHQAGYEIAGAVEFDKSISESLQKNHPNTVVYNRDITQLEPQEVENKIGKVDVIIGGPPCQGFSTITRRLGTSDKRNFLFKEYMRFVEYFKPKYIVIENVVGILSADKGAFVAEIVSDLEKLGYVVEYKTLTASDFGVPQKRKRVIFMGTLSNQKIPPLLAERKAGTEITVWEAISDLAYLESAEGEFESEYKILPESQYQETMRQGSKKLYNHIATNHAEIALDRLRRIPPEKGKEYLEERVPSRFGSSWGRLKKDKPSPTVITRFDSPSCGQNSHPYLHRSITPREAARLQSFPDTFIFHGKKSSVIKQIGNAVPPLLGKAIAQHILEYEKKAD